MYDRVHSYISVNEAQPHVFKSKRRHQKNFKNKRRPVSDRFFKWHTAGIKHFKFFHIRFRQMLSVGFPMPLAINAYIELI